jgi:Pyridoxal-dependent decarboxylase, C-terminal sheet domain/PEP-CTERM motif
VLISQKSPHERERWIYLDAGLYNGLDETLDERIHYPIRTPHDGSPWRPVVLAGPTCDSADILYRRHPYELPLALEIGDPVVFLSAGAYTASVPDGRIVNNASNSGAIGVTGFSSTTGPGSGSVAVAVPEPSSLALCGTALLGLGFIARRRRRR